MNATNAVVMQSRGMGRSFALRFAAVIAAAWPLSGLGERVGTLLVPPTTWLVHKSALLTGLPNGRSGQLMWFGRDAFTYEVAPACTALTPCALYAAAVLAYPGVTARRRVTGLATGVAALQGLNIIRLLALAWIGARVPSAFHAAHWVGFQLVFVLALGGLWWWWVRGPTHQAGTRAHRWTPAWRGVAIVCTVVITAAIASRPTVNSAHYALMVSINDLVTRPWPAYIPVTLSHADLLVYALSTTAMVAVVLTSPALTFRSRVGWAVQTLLPLMLVLHVGHATLNNVLDHLLGTYTRPQDPGFTDRIAALWELGHGALLGLAPFVAWSWRVRASDPCA